MDAEKILKEVKRKTRSEQILQKALAYVKEERGKQRLLYMLAEAERERKHAEEEAMCVIESIKNENIRMLLRLKYLEFLSMEEIAETMHYSLRHCYRLQKQAIYALSV